MKSKKYTLGICVAISTITFSSFALADHMSPWGEGFALDPLGNHSAAVERVDPGSEGSGMDQTSVSGNDVALQDLGGQRSTQSNTQTQPGPNEDNNMDSNSGDINELETAFFEKISSLAESTESNSQKGSSTEVESANELDEGEETHLIFMREEEKLAHDVYYTLAEYWRDKEDVTVFVNIIASESNHTGIIADKLEKYDIDDPSTTDEVGVFTGEDYGWYFDEKYNLLVESGTEVDLGDGTIEKKEFLDALYVGALIEELDMYDIVQCPKVIVESENGIEEGECGMLYTDERSLFMTYSNLLEGSKDHLRAFVKNIEAIIGEGEYEARYLDQEEVDEILGR